MAVTANIIAPGETLGGYRIDDIIGVGGMAIVYRAEQLSLGRKVALKVLTPQLSNDPAFRERFRREGKHAAALDHPNVVTIYDSGEIEGRLFLAMRLVDGATLAERMPGEGLSAEDTLAVLRPIAGALDEAHRIGLVHRDVKPQNILITAAGHPYLADFGVARGTSATGGLTSVGGFVGSINYASPEQILGQRPSAAADVYALTAVLYQCLTGQVPYPRDTDAGVMHAHLNDPPPALPPLSREAGALDRVIARGMAKRPEARYQQAGDLIGDAAEVISRLSPAQRRCRPAFPAGGANGVAAQSGTADSAAAPSPTADDWTPDLATGASDALPAVADLAQVATAAAATPIAAVGDPPPIADRTEVVGAEERRARRQALDTTTADRRRELPSAPAPKPARRRPGRKVLAGAAVVVAAGAVTGVILALVAGGGTAVARASRVTSGPVTVSFPSPWTATAGGGPVAAALTAPAAVREGAATLEAGVLVRSAAIPAGPPPALVHAFGHPAGQRSASIGGRVGISYEWTRATGTRVVALVVGARTSDIALVCSAPAVAPALLNACLDLARHARINSPDLLPPGPDVATVKGLAAALDGAAAGRRQIVALKVGSLPKRSSTAMAISGDETRSARVLAAISSLPRNRGAISALTHALQAEASGFAALARAAGGNDRAAYSAEDRQITSAEIQVQHALRALGAEGFRASLAPITLPGLPAVHVAKKRAAPGPTTAPVAPTTSAAPASPAPTVSTPHYTPPVVSSPPPVSTPPVTPHHNPSTGQSLSGSTKY